MTYGVRVTPRAEHDRDRAFVWFAENYSTEYALQWYDGLDAAIRSLHQYPARCGVAHESNCMPFELRELLYGEGKHRFRVFFTIAEREAVVLHLRHLARQDMSENDL